jgi:hypothetical protein
MSVAMTFGGALTLGPRNATTTINFQSRSFERHLRTFYKGFRLQIYRSAFFVKMRFLRNFAISQTVVVFCPIRVRGRATDRPAEPRMGQNLA